MDSCWLDNLERVNLDGLIILEGKHKYFCCAMRIHY
mgnify:CR=1 FL=1